MDMDTTAAYATLPVKMIVVVSYVVQLFSTSHVSGWGSAAGLFAPVIAGLDVLARPVSIL